MKKGLLIFALLTMGSAYAANNTAVQTTYNVGTPNAYVIDGFSESSFDYGTVYTPASKDICFKGSAQGVCSIINKVAGAMNKEYSEGAHDTMNVISCEVVGESVKAVYQLTDDYGGDLTANRTIEACK